MDVVFVATASVKSEGDDRGTKVVDVDAWADFEGARLKLNLGDRR